MAKWLCTNGMATPMQNGKNSPGTYMATALPMAQAMATKWGIDPSAASSITTKLLSPMKQDEQNPVAAPATPGEYWATSLKAIRAQPAKQQLVRHSVRGV